MFRRSFLRSIFISFNAEREEGLGDHGGRGRILAVDDVAVIVCLLGCFCYVWESVCVCERERESECVRNFGGEMKPGDGDVYQL